MKRTFLVFLIITLLGIQSAYAVDVLPQPFFNYLNSKYLADPGIILVDPTTNEIVYQSGADKPRTPASVLKIFSTAAIALSLPAETTFQTAIYKTNKKGQFVIWGDYDPWITSNSKFRDANDRAYLPKLIKAAFASDKKLKKINILYRGVNGSDIYFAKKALKRRASVAYKPIGAGIEVESLITEKITSIQSPPLSKMIRFALLYSDNVLSQRLAMLATRKNGYPITEQGLNEMVKSKMAVPIEICCLGVRSKEIGFILITFSRCIHER